MTAGHSHRGRYRAPRLPPGRSHARYPRTTGSSSALRSTLTFATERLVLDESGGWWPRIRGTTPEADRPYGAGTRVARPGARSDRWGRRRPTPAGTRQ